MKRELVDASAILGEHVRRVGLALRPLGIGAGIVLLAITLVQVYDYEILGDGTERVIVFLLVALVPALVAGRTWFQNEVERRAYFWSLPVGRRGGQLATVAAGWFWLMLAATVLLARVVLLSKLTGSVPESGRLPMPIPHDVWHFAFAYSGMTLIYLFASVLMIVARRTWYPFIAIGFVVLIQLGQQLSNVPFLVALFGLGRFGLGMALTGRTLTAPGEGSSVAEPAAWAMAAGLWLAISLTSVWGCSSIHREA